MEIETKTTALPELLHPEDAEYIWLPILVLVGVVILAGLVKLLFLICIDVCTTAFLACVFTYVNMKTTLGLCNVTNPLSPQLFSIQT